MAVTGQPTQDSLNSAHRSATKVLMSSDPVVQSQGWSAFAEQAVRAITDELAEIKDSILGYSSVTTITTTYTIKSTDVIVLCNATGGNFTVTLPSAVGLTGKRYHVKKIDTSANVVKLDGDGSETIDDSASLNMVAQYECVHLASDGTEWWVI